ncbi:MAG: molybdopterin-dependent oxidoreductase [Chloroflexi bacterium]|nr:molybdopterin-dependent oxidoreductase [Chloroflexota bacterium]
MGSDSFAGAMYAEQATYGSCYTANTRDDLTNARLIIMWGWNPTSTVAGVNTCWYLVRAREVGARIIAVDPRYTDSAAVFAQEWIPIRPGTDGAMLLAMAHTMMTEGLHNEAFLDTYTLGFDKFRDYVMGATDGVPKTSEWAEAITGVSAMTIRDLARMYATIKPVALLAGIAPGRTAYGEQYHRIAITLAAMTGNIGVHGGDAAGRAWGSIVPFGGYPYKIGHVLGTSNPVTERALAPPGGSPPGYRASKLHRMYENAVICQQGLRF